MSQAYGRMYHPSPHQHHQHHPGPPPFRQAGEGSHHQGYPSHRGYHQNHYSPSRPTPSHNYNNSVSVYSVPKPSRPYNTYNNRRGRGGGNTGRGGYHNNHHSNPQGYNNHSHNNYRSHPLDFDLEWDHYDFNADGPSGQRGGRQRNARSHPGGGATLNDAELEWDDYDLRPKEEEEEDSTESLDYILTEGVFPLIGVVTKAPLSRGHIPLGAIQVCRFPQGGSFKAFASPDHFAKSLRLNKDLLVLTSELKEGSLLSGFDSPNETKDFLLSDLALTRNKDDSSSLTDTPSKESESEGASNDISEEDLDEDLLNETYESGYQDRLGDIDLYALAPHDFDSPDSTFSRSLADLTDISLCYNNLDYLDRSMASRINKQAAKRKHKASGQAHTNNPQHTSKMSLQPGSTLEQTSCTKHAPSWGESSVDEDGCSVKLEPETGSVLFRVKIRRRSPPSLSLDPQEATAATNSMPIKSEPLTSPEEVTDDDLTISDLGNIDIFEPDSVSDFSINTSPTTRSFKEFDEELGIDPSLVKAGLERTRSLGDATRAQDASKDRGLKGAKTKKRKRKGSEKVEESTAAGAGDEANEKKTKRLAPNFFVAVQVSNPQIHEALRDVQQTVVTGDEKLKDAMVPIATLHLTIMVMHLATEEDVERAKEALDECHQLLSPRFEKEKLSILFGGLGHFNNQVMFAKIKDQDNILEILYEIADTVEKCFSDYNLVSTGERGFKPHLTVMKLSRAPSLRKKGVRRIKSELYKAHSNQVFGEQVLEGLQLCSINKPKTLEGYYCKAAEVLFGDPASRLDRDIHTIAEGVEPSVESNRQRTSEDSSDRSQTTESVNRTLGPEEPMDLNNCESTTDKPSQSLPGNESSPADGHVNKVSAVNHERRPHPVCDSAGDHRDCTADDNSRQCNTISNSTENSSKTCPSSPSNGTTAEEQLNQLNNEKCSRSQSIDIKGTESAPLVVNGRCNEESFNGNHQDKECKTLCENPSAKVIK